MAFILSYQPLGVHHRHWSAWDNQGWIFCNRIGRPIEVGKMLGRSFQPILIKAGLPIIRFHDVRRFGDCKIALKGQKVRAITF
jgi:hypothetical protein